MKTIFEAKATNTGGRSGHVESEDGVLDFDISMPNSKGKPDPKSTNPEELFAAAYSTCFAGALEVVAKEHGVGNHAKKEDNVATGQTLHSCEIAGLRTISSGQPHMVICDLCSNVFRKETIKFKHGLRGNRHQ